MALSITILMALTGAIVLFKLALFATVVAIGAKTLLVPSQQLSPARIQHDAVRRLLINRY